MVFVDRQLDLRSMGDILHFINYSRTVDNVQTMPPLAVVFNQYALKMPDEVPVPINKAFADKDNQPAENNYIRQVLLPHSLKLYC